MLFIVLSMKLCSPADGLAQYDHSRSISFEDYAGEFFSAEDAHLPDIEEWQDMIGQWLEQHLSINTEEADMLMEYKIISLFQLNTLKAYRHIYGNLLSIYELAFIEGWDAQTIRKVMPLAGIEAPENERALKKFSYKSFQHNLVMKTSFNVYKSKAYRTSPDAGLISGNNYYGGPAARMAIRYDLEYRRKLVIGIRTEKDPGEPCLISRDIAGIDIKAPDLVSGYMLARDLGFLHAVIIGNYRVNFGYGMNLAGGQTAIRNNSGISGMAHRIRPQTSVGESGFFRGLAVSAGMGKVILSAFVSSQKLDGTSIQYDTLSGKPRFFSSINKSGLHRTSGELMNRKEISEKVAGGFFVFRNNWMKAGLIAIYNRFNASVITSGKAYDKFDLSGQDNLVTGFSATIWLPGIQVFTESSLSKNKGFAIVNGVQLSPVPGSMFILTHRHFGLEYQNWNGSGYISSGRNSGESGLDVLLKLELPKKWLFKLGSDVSASRWASYSLDAPSKRQQVVLAIEKNLTASQSFIFSFRYINEDTKNTALSNWICRTKNLAQYRFRAEARVDASAAVRLRSRIEYSLEDNEKPGFLILQDVEITSSRLMAKWWLRICFFDATSFTNSIYAYENDVMYDFTTFLHYGKGLRGIIMMKANLNKWLDFWIRMASVYYTNKKAGSGWDEVEGNRQIELEAQARIRLSH